MCNIKQYIIKKIFKRNNKSKEYIDLAPIDEISEEKEYIKALHWALKNKRIKNIALAGPYGSGKSSIINSYLKVHQSFFRKYVSRSKHDRTNLRISMATFSEQPENDEDQKNTLISIDSTAIEREILKQIFYKVKVSKIPQSRYRKLHRHSLFTTLLYFFIISASAIASCFVFFPDTFYKILDLIQSAGTTLGFSQKTTLGVGIICFLTLSILLSNAWNYVHNRIHIKEVKVQDASIAATTSSEESIFDKYMDEILYFFEVTKYSVVFFEDLDRLQSPEIFVELRELNTILNNSEAINRKITFVYAIKDDIFASEDRTKFFDFIIPVIPTINSTNSGEVMLELFQPSTTQNPKGAITTEFILDVSPFISDMRMLDNIYNEFLLYKRTLSDEQQLHLRDTEMLSLIIFKNLYPKIFSDLQAEQGLIKDIFISKKTFIESKTKEINDRIQADINLIAEFEAEHIKNIKELKIAFLSAVTNFDGIALYFRESSAYNSILAYTQDVLKDDFDILKLLEGKNIYVRYLSWDGDERSMDWPLIRDSYEKYSTRLKMLKQVEVEKIETIKQRIEQNQVIVHSIAQMTIQSLIKEFGPAELFPNKCTNPLLLFLLRKGYIDETYPNYMNYFKGNSLTVGDMNFILNIKNHNEPDYHYSLTKKDQVINRLQVHEFREKAALNFDLLEQLLASNEYSQKLDAFIDQLIYNSQIEWLFIDEFINITHYQERFIYLLATMHPDFWKCIYRNYSISYRHKFKYFTYILSNDKISIDSIVAQDMEGCLSKFITDHENTLKDLKNVESARLKAIISGLKLVFTKIETKDVDPDVLDYIFDNGMYCLNNSMIYTIISYKRPSLCQKLSSQNFTAILALDYEPLKKKIKEHFTDYVDNIVLSKGNTHESFSAIMSLVTLAHDDWPMCEKIIKSQDFYYVDLNSCLPEMLVTDPKFVHKICKLLMSLKKVFVSWKNIIIYWDHFEDTEFLQAYVSENIKELVKYSYPTEGTEKFENRLITLEFPPAIFKELAQRFRKEQINEFKFSQIPQSNLFILILLHKVPYTLERHKELLDTYPDLINDFIIEGQSDFTFDAAMDTHTLESLLADERSSIDFKRSLVEHYCPGVMSKIIANAIVDQHISVNMFVMDVVWTLIDSKKHLALLVNNLSILKIDDCQKYFSKMRAPYLGLADRTSRHVVDLPFDEVNMKLVKYLNRINYITSFEKHSYDITVTQVQDKSICRKTVIRCRVKACK